MFFGFAAAFMKPVEELAQHHAFALARREDEGKDGAAAVVRGEEHLAGGAFW